MKRILTATVGLCVILAGVGTTEAAVLYGTARPGSYADGDIYSIDTGAQTSTLLVDLSATPVIPSGSPDIAPIAPDSPNGNAFDGKNGRFYFTSFMDPGSPATPTVPPSELYYVDVHDPSAIVWAGTLGGHASDAAFYGERYWYIGHGTNVLRAVTFNPDGSLATDGAVASVLHGEPGSLIFGDVAFDSEGLLYLTGAIKNQGTGYKRSVSGTMDTSTGAFTEIGSSLYWGQIAFGLDDVLYGHGSGTG
ncbi:MAG: hypothetical protein JSU70_03865, partial [Phycisphaerales bacterium]